MTQDTQYPPNDPLLNTVYNDGLEWAAAWIETYIPGSTPEVQEFARNMAMSIRAAKRPDKFQETFAHAIRDDPYMSPEHKQYWLSVAESKK